MRICTQRQQQQPAHVRKLHVESKSCAIASLKFRGHGERAENR